MQIKFHIKMLFMFIVVYKILKIFNNFIFHITLNFCNNQSSDTTHHQTTFNHAEKQKFLSKKYEKRNKNKKVTKQQDKLMGA